MLRPWPADDGLLVRLRLIGGHVTATQLTDLVGVAERYGDGRIHVTSRANLQLRAFPGTDGHLDEAALLALESTGLLPTRTHELMRNVMISPRTGIAGGRADLTPLGRDLDARLCADPALAHVPGKFLFVLDDGRGDLLNHTCDLGLVALDDTTAQLRIGDGWGEIVDLNDASTTLVELTVRFLQIRGTGPTAAWHVQECATPLADAHRPDPRLPTPIDPLPYGDVPGGRHVEVPATGLDRAAIDTLTADSDRLIVTPWRGIYLPKDPA